MLFLRVIQKEQNDTGITDRQQYSQLFCFKVMLLCQNYLGMLRKGSVDVEL